MAAITREYLNQKRQAYLQQRNMIDGALIALDEIEAELFPTPLRGPEDALTLDELGQTIGAAEIGEPQNIGESGVGPTGPTHQEVRS
jgi:hypothetical protein